MDYKGLKIPIPFGKDGFTGSDDLDSLPAGALKEAKNIRYDEGIVRKAGGMSTYDANVVTGSPTALAGTDWWPTSSIQRQVTVWSNGKVYKEVSGDMDSVELGTGFTFSNPVMLVPCGQELVGNDRKLLMFSKGVAPQVLSGDGATISALANVSANWSSTNQPAGGIMHDNRVVTFGNPAAPHDIEFSALDDHTNFKSSDPTDAAAFPLPAFSIMPGEAEGVNACFSIGTTRLYMFKYPTGIYFIDTDQMTSFVAPVTTVRKDIGVAGPMAITKVGSLGTWFIGSDGHIYSLDMLNDPNADIRDTCITKAKKLKKWIKDNVLPSRLGYARLIYDSNKGEVIASYSKVGGSVNAICLVFDVNDPSNIRISTEDRGTYYNAMWFAKESNFYQQLLTAGTGGLVYKMNQNNRLVGADGFLASAKSASNDLSYYSPELGDKNKRFDWLEIRSLTTGGTTDVNVDLYIDDRYYNTFSFASITGGSPLAGGSKLTSYTGDGANYGLTPNTLKLPFTLARGGYVRRMIKIGGLGKRIAFRFYNSAANGDFGIGNVYLYCDPLISGAEV